MIRASISWKIGVQIDPEKMKNHEVFKLYRGRIAEICGVEGQVQVLSDKIDEPDVYVISHRDIPEKGDQTSFSFGLSSLDHPDWIHSRPELMISVKSDDPLWSVAMGEMIRMVWDRSNFTFGKAFDFGSPIAGDSDMDCFLIYGSGMMDKDDLTIFLPDRKVFLSQVYPMYQSEIGLMGDLGVEAFVNRLGDALFDVHRAPIG